MECLWRLKRGGWKHSLWSVMKNTPVLMLNHADFVQVLHSMKAEAVSYKQKKSEHVRVLCVSTLNIVKNSWAQCNYGKALFFCDVFKYLHHTHSSKWVGIWGNCILWWPVTPFEMILLHGIRFTFSFYDNWPFANGIKILFIVAHIHKTYWWGKICV